MQNETVIQLERAMRVERRLFELNQRRVANGRKPVRRNAIARAIKVTPDVVTRAFQGLRPDVLDRVERRIELIESSTSVVQ